MKQIIPHLAEMKGKKMFYEDDMKPQTDGGSVSSDSPATDDSGDKEEDTEAI